MCDLEALQLLNQQHLAELLREAEIEELARLARTTATPRRWQLPLLRWSWPKPAARLVRRNVAL
jgi:hypothetical protein